MNIQILRYITIIALSVSSAFAQDAVSHPYYPLSVGAEWQYDMKLENGAVHRTVVKTIGDTLFHVKSNMNFGLIVVRTDWEKLVIRKNGVYRVAIRTMDDPEYVKITPAELVLPLQLKVGIKWKSYNHVYEVTEHHLDVTVTSKTYEDCYIIETVNSISGNKERFYYARDYGMVLTSMKSQSPGSNWDWVLAMTKSAP